MELTNNEISKALKPIYVSEPPKRFDSKGHTTWAFQIADAIIKEMNHKYIPVEDKQS